MSINVIFTKVHKSAKVPTHSHFGDAGWDLVYAGDKTRIIYSGESVLLGTGLKVCFSPDYVMEIKNRSGMAAKKQLLIGACVVDSNFRAEVMVNIHNFSGKTCEINPGDRIAQAIFHRLADVSFLEYTNEEYERECLKDSERQLGGFGSSGN